MALLAGARESSQWEEIGRGDATHSRCIHLGFGMYEH